MEFISYKNTKYPIDLNMGCIVAYKVATGISFLDDLNSDPAEDVQFQKCLTMFHIALTEGAKLQYSQFRQFINKVRTKNIHGFKSKELYNIFSVVFPQFMKLLPTWYKRIRSESVEETNETDSGIEKKT
jgi:hypothetical protein